MNFRRLLGEFIGTFVIVFAPVAASSCNLPLLGMALVSGFAVLAMVFALGPISGAHFNPAVSFGFAAAGRFPWRHLLSYWLMQFAGAIAAAGVGAYLFGAGYGVHIPQGRSLLQDFALEVVLTFVLMLVIMAVATDRRVPASVPGLAIGLAVVMGVLIGGPLTGGSMNPARSFGPALFAGGRALQSVWLYLSAPLLGALFAALVYEILRLEPEHRCDVPQLGRS